MCFDGSMGFSSAVHPYQQTTYFREGLDPISRAMRWTVHSRSSAPGIFERLCQLDHGINTSEAKCACCLVHIWHKCGRGVDASIVGSWDTQSIDTVLGILSSSLLTMRDWTLIRRKIPRVP